MPGIDDFTSKIGGVDFAGTFNTAMYWMGYGIGALMIIAVLAAFMYFMGFKYKMLYFPVRGNVNNNLTVDRAKRNKFKWNKSKTAWKPLYPLFNKQQVEPFKNEYIYAGNQLYAFKVGENYLPAELAVNEVNKFNIMPVSYSVKNWLAGQMKQNEIEFRKKSMWDENKTVFLCLITVLVCMAAVVVTVYYTYQYAGGRLDTASSMFTQAVSSVQANAPA